MYKIPELLAPAGSFETLKTAYYFGADAAYIAGKSFGLRAFAANFDDDALKEAVLYAHERQKKLYITVNSVIHNHQLADLKDYLVYLSEIGADAVIFADPAVAKIIRDEHIPL